MVTSVGKCFLLVWTGFTIGVMWMGAATECREEQQYWWSSVNPFAAYKDLSRVQSGIFLRVFAPDVALQAGAGAATLISTLVGGAGVASQFAMNRWQGGHMQRGTPGGRARRNPQVPAAYATPSFSRTRSRAAELTPEPADTPRIVLLGDPAKTRAQEPRGADGGRAQEVLVPHPARGRQRVPKLSIYPTGASPSWSPYFRARDARRTPRASTFRACTAASGAAPTWTASARTARRSSP